MCIDDTCLGLLEMESSSNVVINNRVLTNKEVEVDALLRQCLDPLKILKVQDDQSQYFG